MRIPRELLPDVPVELEDVILRAVGFSIVNGVLESVPAIATPRAWRKELERALGPRA